MKRIYKGLAILLTGAMLLSLAPPFTKTVLANAQNAVTDGKITVNPSSQANNYNLTFTWTRPAPLPYNQTVDHSPIDGGAGWYRLDYAKGSSTALTQVPGYNVLTDPAYVLATSGLPLDSGSIYCFRVNPFHKETITYLKEDGTVNYTSTSDQFPAANSYRDMLFLTDITVSARGSGNTLTVTWDNPTLDGQPVFQSWNIYYTSDQRANPSFTNPAITVQTSQAVSSGGKLSYTIADPSISYTQKYTIKVEPCYWGTSTDLRNYGSLGNSVQVANKTYSGFFFTPIGNNNAGLYWVRDISVDTPLDWMDAGNDILLYWPGFGSADRVQRIQILMSTNREDLVLSDDPTAPRPEQKSKILGEIQGTANCMTIRSYPTEKPKVKTYYRLHIIGDNGVSYYSDIVEYDPTSAAFKPTKPVIRYFDVPNLDASPMTFKVSWDAFLRAPFTAAEAEPGNLISGSTAEYNGKYLDRNVEYDIYISDDLEYLYRMPFDTRVNGKTYTAAELPIDTGNYTYSISGITQYYGKDGLPRPIAPNKIYYVRVVARRAGASPGNVNAENEAYRSCFVPAQDLYTRPQMISKPPLRIKKDADGNQVVTTNTITIEWDTCYFEVFDAATNSWHTKIGYDGQKFVYGDNIDYKTHKPVELVPYQTLAIETAITRRSGKPAGDTVAVEEKIKAYYGLSNSDTVLTIRFIDLSDASFAVYAEPYPGFENPGEYDSYIAPMKAALESGSWAGTLRAGTNTDSNKPYTLEHTFTGLAEETSYLIILWPYITASSGQLIAMAPANIIGTTQGVRGDVDITPTVPVLYYYPNKTDATSITVYWPYLPELMYELHYDEVLPADRNQGIIVTHDMIMENNRPYMETVNGVETEVIAYTIENLFPETMYYAWVKAYIINPSGNRRDSDWSNEVAVRTLEIAPPDPPTGLGLVGENNLDVFNKLNNLNYTPTDFNYLILEWVRVYKDRSATNPDTNGIGEVIFVPDNLVTYIVKFNDLDPNTSYYARAKTRMTVTKMDIGASIEYQYIVQLSKDDEFNEYSEVIIPFTITGGQTAGTRYIVKDSEWTRTIRLFTATWTGEYDGDVDPQTYPLPETDYELSYDPNTGTLTYRFRSNETDQSGDRDNYADQRFISRLITSNTYNFTIDLSRYNSIMPKKRVVEIPYSVYSAMADRYISLTVICGGTTYTFPAQFLNMPEVYAMSGYGYNAVVRIVAEDNPGGMPTIDLMSETHAVIPNKLSVKVTAGTETLSLTRTLLPITVAQEVTNRSLLYNRNVGAYGYFGNSKNWLPADYEINDGAGIITQTAYDIGSYTAISRVGPIALVQDPETQNAVTRVSSRIAFTDMLYYDPNGVVSSGQFNKLTAAVAAGSSSVSINSPLTADEKNSLTKGGLVAAESDALLREEAIALLVRLYELKTKTLIQDYTPLTSSVHLDIAAADERYQTGLLKAADLGFFENKPDSVRPKEIITFGELMRIIELIIDYSGM